VVGVICSAPVTYVVACTASVPMLARRAIRPSFVVVARGRERGGLELMATALGASLAGDRGCLAQERMERPRRSISSTIYGPYKKKYSRVDDSASRSSCS
jgi:hypothetical protein